MGNNASILSPIPGVFYRKPSPEQDVYVKEGEAVKIGDIVALVEVMKNFYEVKAEADGVIERFLVSEEELIDAGQEIAVFAKK